MNESRKAHRFAMALVVTVLALTTAQTRAASLTVMAGGASKIVYLPLILASQLGYFRAEGLDVDILSQAAGVDTATELLAGAIQGAVGYYDHTIDLQSRGTDMVSLVVFVKTAGEVELVSSRAAASFSSMADAKHKTLGVTGLGASTNFLTRYLAQQANLSPRDYNIMPVGSADNFVAAMNRNAIDAGMVEEPTATWMISSGRARVLVDMRGVEASRRALGGPYASACFYVARSWLDAHPNEAQKLVNAFVRALSFIAHHNAEQIAAVVPRDFYEGKSVGKALYIEALNASLPTFTTDGRMPSGAPETVLRTLSGPYSTIKPRYTDLSRTYTNALVDNAASKLSLPAPSTVPSL